MKSINGLHLSVPSCSAVCVAVKSNTPNTTLENGNTLLDEAIANKNTKRIMLLLNHKDITVRKED